MHLPAGHHGQHRTLKLLKVQKHFVSLIPGLQGSYEEKLVILGLQSLKARRRRADMIATFKILRGFGNVDSQDWFTTYGANARVTRTASYCLNIVPKHSNTDVRRNFLTNRVINEWNALPNSHQEQCLHIII